MRILVTFSIWGQSSETIFTENSELLPAQWCAVVYEKGFAYPTQITDLETGNVVMDEPQLTKIMMEMT